MTNYYEELQIDQSCSLDDINDKLGELEAKWIRRETVNPDKAREMLTFISDAKKVFKDADSRRNYDSLLAGGGDNNSESTGTQTESSATENARREADRAEVNRWIKKAERYYNNKEYDLAVEAMEEVLDRTKPSERDDYTYALAAAIYDSASQFELALKYINKAIAKRSIPHYYNQKASICFSRLQQADWQNTDNVRTQMQYALEDALKIETNNEDKGITYGLYAAMYWELNATDRAEEYANKAVQCGDKWGYGKQILRQAKRKAAINTYSSLMPTGFVLFFIVDILTIILIPASGGAIGILMLILSLGATGFLTYSAGAYPYGGSGMAWGIILSIVFGIVIAILFGNNYEINSSIPVIELFCMVALVIVCSVLGRVKRTEILS